MTIAMVDGADLPVIGGSSIEYDVVPGLPSPEHCLAHGDGTRGAWSCCATTFELEARDAAGNLIIDHPLILGQNLKIAFSPGSNQQKVEVEAYGDGRYKVLYNVPVSGMYSLSVMVGERGSARACDRRHVRGSPFNVPIHSSATEKAAKALERSPQRGHSPTQALGSPRRSESPRRSARGSSSPRSGRPSSSPSSPTVASPRFSRPRLSSPRGQPSSAPRTPTDQPSSASAKTILASVLTRLSNEAQRTDALCLEGADPHHQTAYSSHNRRSLRLVHTLLSLYSCVRPCHRLCYSCTSSAHQAKRYSCTVLY